MCLKDLETFKPLLNLWHYLELKGKQKQRFTGSSRRKFLGDRGCLSYKLKLSLEYITGPEIAVKLYT